MIVRRLMKTEWWQRLIDLFEARVNARLAQIDARVSGLDAVAGQATTATLEARLALAELRDSLATLQLADTVNAALAGLLNAQGWTGRYGNGGGTLTLTTLPTGPLYMVQNADGSVTLYSRTNSFTATDNGDNTTTIKYGGI